MAKARTNRDPLQDLSEAAQALKAETTRLRGIAARLGRAADEQARIAEAWGEGPLGLALRQTDEDQGELQDTLEPLIVAWKRALGQPATALLSLVSRHLDAEVRLYERLDALAAAERRLIQLLERAQAAQERTESSAE